MGWIDFTNNNPIGKILSRTATSTLNAVDTVVQNTFDKGEEKIDRISTSLEKVGGGIDNIHNTTKNLVSDGCIDRYIVEDTCKDIKDIYEGSKEFEKEIQDLNKQVPTNRLLAKD